jgi:hypothetical protein
MAEDKLPEVAPHVVFEEMADVAKKYGYYLQHGVKLVYWVHREQVICTIDWPQAIKERSDDG